MSHQLLSIVCLTVAMALLIAGTTGNLYGSGRYGRRLLGVVESKTVRLILSLLGIGLIVVAAFISWRASDP